MVIIVTFPITALFHLWPEDSQKSTFVGIILHELTDSAYFSVAGRTLLKKIRQIFPQLFAVSLDCLAWTTGSGITPQPPNHRQCGLTDYWRRILKCMVMARLPSDWQIKLARGAFKDAATWFIRPPPIYLPQATLHVCQLYVAANPLPDRMQDFCRVFRENCQLMVDSGKFHKANWWLLQGGVSGTVHQG